jgi:hypothetical protein
MTEQERQAEINRLGTLTPEQEKEIATLRRVAQCVPYETTKAYVKCERMYWNRTN